MLCRLREYYLKETLSFGVAKCQSRLILSLVNRLNTRAHHFGNISGKIDGKTDYRYNNRRYIALSEYHII